MKRVVKQYVAAFGHVTAFSLSLLVFLWAIKVLGGYAADRVTSYAGPTPMALDTAICLAILAIVGMLLSRLGNDGT